LNILSKELNLFLMALTFYTRLSLLQPKNYQANLLAKANRYFPLVGLLIGLLAGGLTWLSLQIFPVSVSAWLMVFFGMAITGAFHEDGLSDTFDSLGAWTIAHRLRIMKDSAIGTYGAAAMVFSVGIRYLFWSSLPVEYWFVAAVLVHTLSRILPLFVIWFLDYVREDETSKVKPVAKNIEPFDLMIASGFGVVVLGLADYFFSTQLVVSIGISLMIALGCIVYWFRKILGGYTGDLLGASQQISEWVVLGVLVAHLAVDP
jgi:adenosylcobinamide-GDP ribazoletransferase